MTESQEMVMLPAEVQKVADLLRAFARWYSDQQGFQPFARQALDGFADEDVRAILIRGVDVGQAAVVSVADQAIELLLAEPHLVGRALHAHRAGADAQERAFQAGLADRHLVGGGA